jgi:hypothetical protein
VIELEDPETISECIAAQIGLFQGIDRAAVVDDLVSLGTAKGAAVSVERALVPAGDAAPKGAVQKIPASSAPSGVATF